MQSAIKLIILSSLAIFISTKTIMAQKTVKNYTKEWKRVEQYSEKGLPKSALAELNKIYALAKKEGQDAQVIKALLYKTQLMEEIEEEADTLAIKAVEKEIRSAKAPVKNILQSYLAGLYWSFYEMNRWNLYDRTETFGLVKTDIKSWTVDDFHKKVSELYLASLENEVLLKATSLRAYDAMLNKGNMRHLRPTLFDFLGHRALEYFMNDEREISRPAYAFEIDQAEAFAPAAEFVNVKFTTSDSLSLQHKALLLFQRLVKFHLNDAKPDALVDVDIARLTYVKNKSVHPANDSLYLAALTVITGKYKDLPAASMAWYLMAEDYHAKAAGYKAYGDSTHRLSRVKAKEILERVLQQKDSSEGKVLSHNLLKTINEPGIEFMVEKANTPQLPFRSLVKYRNISKVYLRIIPINKEISEAIETSGFWKAISGLKPIRSWEETLPLPGDLQEHLAEIKIDGLPAGNYAMLISNNKNFQGRDLLMGGREFYVSGISWVNDDNDHFVLNRETGQPLANAAVQVWQHYYKQSESKYVKEKTRQYTTDANGFFKMEKAEEEERYRNYFLDITHGGERLFMTDRMNTYYLYRNGQEPEEKKIISIFLFTDRGLYRPGQTLHFKGIVVEKNRPEKKSGIISDHTTTIYLKDNNGQAVDSMVVNTNEFGSFSGSFRIPEGLMNGTFILSTTDNKGYATVQVEEYKRPRFLVEFQPLQGSYRVNDSISVTGEAKAYAGNTVSGAKVKYRVVRQPRFLYPWMGFKWWLPPTTAMEIAHGEVVTDENGKFTITFKAIPDLTIDRKFEPAFDYSISADVTDINGETRSAEQTVSVSYKAIILNVDVAVKMPVDSLRSIKVRTQNMAGEFVPSTVTVTIKKLREEKRLIRSRYWARPDQFIMTKEEYLKLFPHDEYDNETDVNTWEVESTVFSSTDSSRKNGDFTIDKKPAKGFYVIEITTTDKYGETVKDVKHVELYDEMDRHLNRMAYLSVENSKSVEPGEKAVIKIGTSANDVFLIQQRKNETNQKIPGYTFFQLNNERRNIDFKITEENRGGFGLSYLFVKHNRVFTANETIDVPWTNKDLQIEYATFRDKTLPGSQEQWKVKITGYKNDKVAAELLAGMYDASLDQFYPFNWNKPGTWENYRSTTGWNGTYNFSILHSYTKKEPNLTYKPLRKEYDHLLFAPSYRVYGQRTAFQHDMNPEVRYEADLGLAGRVAGFTTLEYAVVAKGNNFMAAPPGMDGDGRIDQYAFSLSQSPGKAPSEPQVRKNLQETAFFIPHLRTDSTGAIEFAFTMPEALTRWKFQTLAHTKELAFGLSSKEIITQKDLMVQPNAPRFVREGDKMELSAKIVNMTDKEVTGQVELQLIDATTSQAVDGWFKNVMPNQYFTVAANGSEPVTFSIEIPYQFNKALLWRIVARAGNISDGEENVLPVLSNRMLVTETLPLIMREAGTKEFKFEKLVNSAASESLQHHSLTVEYTSNPAWYAVQSLPYLMEYPYECAEQIWNRYYANSLATLIANSSPRIKAIFEQWKNTDTAALLSNLQKNPELKAVLLQETPWVLEAKTEAEQKRNIGLLFDMARMSREQNSSLEKLRQMQNSNGSFVWFAGGPDNRYITQYIVTGVGHLLKLKANGVQDEKLLSMVSNSLQYLDGKMKEDYDFLVKHKTDLKKYYPSQSIIQYLYMRSFFGQPAEKEMLAPYNYFMKRAGETWTSQSKYMQGMIALAISRKGDKQIPAAILNSLMETSINHPESGMYWKNMNRGWFWHEAPIEQQALLIEAFHEIAKDMKTVDDLRTWLLKNKQANNWESTKATAEAVYALLLQGTNWLDNTHTVQIKLGQMNVNTNNQEAGTGYIKEMIEGRKVTPEMGNVSVTVAPSTVGNSSTSWGAVYWQYFEDLDKITKAATPLSLEKKLFIETNTDRGPVLKPVNEGDILKVGDKIKVRIELRVDRDMEFVHMKDMRASGLEPVNVLSGFKWQGGLGYYETTKDASTNFFFDNLWKGTYVFEYPLFITHKGSFSNGITSVQSMYAPEFAAHSEGIRVVVE